MDSGKVKAARPEVKYHPHLISKNRCLVPTCPNKYYQISDKTIDYQNLRFFSLPRDIERRKKWCEILNKETGVKLNYEKYVNKLICENHFRKNCFVPSGRVAHNAFPSLFPLEIHENKDTKIKFVPRTEKAVLPTPTSNFKVFKQHPGENNIEVNKKSIRNSKETTARSTSGNLVSNCFSPITNCSDVDEYHPLVDHDYYTSTQGSPGNSSPWSYPYEDVTLSSSFQKSCMATKTVKSNDIVKVLEGKVERPVSQDEYFVLQVSDTFTPQDIVEESNSVKYLEIKESTTDHFDRKKFIVLEIPHIVASKELTNNIKQPEIIFDDSSPASPAHSSDTIEQETYGNRYMKYRQLKMKRALHRQAQRLKKKAHIVDKQVIFNLATGNKLWCPFQETRNSVVMPYRSTVKSLLHSVSLNSGINPTVFTRLKKKVMKMKEIDKCCMLLFGTMPLTSNLEYCKESNQILGYQDFDNSERATHALVFMIRGLGKHWKQPVAYYFVKNLNAEILSKLIMDVVSMLQEAGLCIVGTICNHMLLNRVTLFNLFNNESDGSNFKRIPYFVVNNQKIVPLYDPSSLLVSTRNALLKYNIEYEPEKFACFHDILHSYNTDKKRRFPKLSKLRPKDLLLKGNNSLKFNVSVASKTLSYSVASCMDLDLGIQGEDTGTFIRNIDLLFDSFNSEDKSKRGVKRFKRSLNDRSGHLLLWKRMIKFVNNWVFHKINDGMKINGLTLKKSWITTLKSAQTLWKTCRTKGIKSLKTKSLNLDPLQNFFASIRYFGARNRNPTQYEFVGAFKLSVLNNLLLPFRAKSNCLRDKGKILDNYQDLFKPSCRNNVNKK